MAMIQIRNVPKDVHRKLKVRAAAEGITLSELLGRQARQLAEQPSLAELCERLRDREPVNPRLTPAQVLREARERP